MQAVLVSASPGRDMRDFPAARVRGAAYPTGRGRSVYLLLNILITFVIIVLVLYLVNMLPLDGRTKQIVRIVVIVIGIKKPSGRMVFNPGPEVVLQVGDVLIMLGDKEQLVRLAAHGV